MEIGRIWSVRYKLKPADRNTTPPSIGTNVASLAMFSDLGCVGMTGYGARVKNVYVTPPSAGVDCELVVQVIEPMGYNGGAGPELIGSRKERRAWNGENTGEMLFISTARTGGGIPVPNQTYFTNMDGATEGGLNGRICHDVVQDKDTIPGVVFTRANFRTAGWSEFRKPNVARVSIRGLSQQEEMTYEPAGNGGRCIQGPFMQNGFVPSRYVVTKGEVAALRTKAIITIETAYARLDPAKLLEYVDTVNSNGLTNLGLPAGSCRMLAPNATRWWKQGALWYANYAMLYDPGCGHNNVETQRQTKMPFKLPLLNEAGAVITPIEYRTVYEWTNKTSTVPAAGAAPVVANVGPETRKPWIERSWAALDGMIQWS